MLAQTKPYFGKTVNRTQQLPVASGTLMSGREMPSPTDAKRLARPGVFPQASSSHFPTPQTFYPSPSCLCFSKLTSMSCFGGFFHLWLVVGLTPRYWKKGWRGSGSVDTSGGLS